MDINRFDKNGKQLQIGDLVYNSYNHEIYKVIYSDDICAFGLENIYGEFDFMSEWVNEEWEVIENASKQITNESEF